jgi:hypothetical protein
MPESAPCLNQPTKKLTKGGVLRKRNTSSLARFNHSCVRNALLEMVRGASKLSWGGGGGCLRWRGICRGGRPWLFQTRGCCYWWEVVPSGNVSFVKRILVGAPCFKLLNTLNTNCTSERTASDWSWFADQGTWQQMRRSIKKLSHHRSCRSVDH